MVRDNKINAANRSDIEAEELPLSVLKLSFRALTVTTPVFLDINDEAGACITSRFRSVQAIEQYLEEQHQAGRAVYLYKLYEKMETYPGGTPEKEMTYTLRYSIRPKKD